MHLQLTTSPSAPSPHPDSEVALPSQPLQAVQFLPSPKYPAEHTHDETSEELLYGQDATCLPATGSHPAHGVQVLPSDP